jgi:YHS domain-containing protein
MKTQTALLIILIILVSQQNSLSQCIPMPKADFSVDPFCETDSASFVNLSQNADSFLWKFGDGQISTQKSPKHFYHGSGTFSNATLVARNSNGCADSITKQYIMNSNPSSEFTYSFSGKDYYFKAEELGTKYRWFFGDGDSANTRNAQHTYKDTFSVHTVCLEVTNAARCVSKTCIQPKFAGIYPLVIQSSFKIFPNPNSGSFTMELKSNKSVNYIEIINQTGQIVYKTEFNQSLHRMNLNLTNGVYYVKVFNVESSIIQKMVVSSSLLLE